MQRLESDGENHQRGVDEEEGMKKMLKWDSSDESEDENTAEAENTKLEHTNKNKPNPEPESNSVEINEQKFRENLLKCMNKYASPEFAEARLRQAGVKSVKEKKKRRGDAAKEEDGAGPKKRSKTETIQPPVEENRVQKSIVLKKTSGDSWDITRLSQENKDETDLVPDQPKQKPAQVAFQISKELRSRAE
jgi:hypothetical protein